MRIYMSNGLFKDMPRATTEDIQGVVRWFQEAGPNDVLSLNFSASRKKAHLQKRHIVEIEVNP